MLIDDQLLKKIRQQSLTAEVRYRFPAREFIYEISVKNY